MDHVLEGIASDSTSLVILISILLSELLSGFLLLGSFFAPLDSMGSSTMFEGLHHLLDEFHRVLGSVDALRLLLILGLFISDDNHSIRGTTRSPNLEHSVVVTLTLFTRSTHIEVFLDGRLVANTTDGLLVRAAIAEDALMDNLGLFRSHIDISEVIRLKKLLENFFGLLSELLVDEVLKSLSGNSELLNLRLLELDLLLDREG